MEHRIFKYYQNRLRDSEQKIILETNNFSYKCIVSQLNIVEG